MGAATYWRRRAGVLGGLVLVIALVAYACSGGAPAKRPAASRLGPASAVSASAPVGPSAVPSQLASSPGPCAAAVLVVSAATDAAHYPAGVLPHLRSVVRNTGTTSCSLTVGGSLQALTILSGNDRIFSSADCTAPDPTARVTLAPAGSYVFGTVWSRQRSRPGCPSPAGEPTALPGTYRLYARLGAKVSAPAIFHLD